MALHQRLLLDIAELQEKPYPNIKVHTREQDISEACLILTPNGGQPLHLTIMFPDNYPLRPPRITIQSKVAHPNVYGSYICASILNTTEGYTPAYTLRGICIQILSFFSSDSIEQEYGGKVDLTNYREQDDSYRYLLHPARPVTCSQCMFDSSSHSGTASVPVPRSMMSVSLADYLPNDIDLSENHEYHTLRGPSVKVKAARTTQNSTPPTNHAAADTTMVEDVSNLALSEDPETKTSISDLPDELLSLVCTFLETEELAPFSQAWSRIGGEQGILSNFNIIRNRELTCFCLKQGFTETKLGVGVHISRTGRLGSFESDFDLLSLQAFEKFGVCTSVQGLPFEHWLPLSISRGHYKSMKGLLPNRLRELGKSAGFNIGVSGSPIDVIYAFMNDIVVRLSTDAQALESRVAHHKVSSLLHTSEKAIESYYHLYHLLLCLATSNDNIVRNVNRTIQSFLNGNTSKAHVPNLGYLLIMVLISDADMSIDLLMAIIRETVTRNVVWVLDKRGANMPELAYMEADAISTYRLQKTFDASKTSYRLLMFLNLFRRTINRGTRTLGQLREELFDSHGAPPRGAAARLANDIKALQQVKNFPQFIKAMSLTPPPASRFTNFLRTCVEDSVIKGYSVWGISQERALTLRKMKDPSVQERAAADQKSQWKSRGTLEVSFFPNKNIRAGNAAGRGRAR
ncbi:hypothetical protein H2198_008568 [Neophaeococcomyces mojaviensis]|uniref:Uncharacterized protein n=1 Tax=Neophaeococcomyces mojaviensis TaxID=3383035 RepID=A0ACC2ZXG7_9EURO|nr:hypothetical protein H2198_008568 [Knufia sp. JES_112]